MVNIIGIVLLTTSVYQVISNPIRNDIQLSPQAASDLKKLNIALIKRSVNSTDDFNKSLNYIDKTIKEVQAILDSNSSLPRLTRGEILEIIENITKADLEAAQKQRNSDRSQKAVMLVMPFTPNNDDDGKMQELYTKPPITKMITDPSNLASTKPKTQKPQTPEYLAPEAILETLQIMAENKTEDPFISVSTAEVRPDSYVQFKPLPDLGEPSEDMEEFLGRFGLGKNSKSSRKSKQYIQDPYSVLNEAPDVEFEMLPDNLRETIKDIGFNDRQVRKMHRVETLNSVNTPNDNVIKPKKQHVFNPMKTHYATQDEIDKLNQLMDIIKQLDQLNGTMNSGDMNQINELVSTLNKSNFHSLDKQKDAPNPIDFDGGIMKNEIKRQENSTTSTEASVSVTASSSLETTLTTTETAETPNIKDLEDSFGGSANGEPEVTVTIPPPTEAPKTGFYYLLDWNTFLDIDDQKGKRVNLRFQPKAGNPQDFIAVSIP